MAPAVPQKALSNAVVAATSVAAAVVSSITKAMKGVMGVETPLIKDLAGYFEDFARG